jgi:hypothetical protein
MIAIIRTGFFGLAFALFASSVSSIAQAPDARQHLYYVCMQLRAGYPVPPPQQYCSCWVPAILGGLNYDDLMAVTHDEETPHSRQVFEWANAQCGG